MNLDNNNKSDEEKALEEIRKALESRKNIISKDRLNRLSFMLTDQGYNDEDITLLISIIEDYNNELLNLSDNDIVSYLICLSNIFKGAENTLNFIRLQSYMDYGYDVVERSKNIFTLDLNLIKSRILDLQNIFQCSYDKVIDILLDRPDWIFHKKEYFTLRIKKLSDFFKRSKEEIVQYVLRHKFVLGKRLNNVYGRICELSEYFGCSIEDVTELMYKYPRLMNWGVQSFKELGLTKEITANPWLLECFNKTEELKFGGYHTFSDLCLYINLLEKLFGKKEKLFLFDCDDFKMPIVLLKNQKGERFLATVGCDILFKDRYQSYVNEIKLTSSLFGLNQFGTFFAKEYFMKINSNKKQEILLLAKCLATYVKSGYTVLFFCKNNNMFNCPIDAVDNACAEKYVGMHGLTDSKGVHLISPYFLRQGVMIRVGTKNDMINKINKKADELYNV